ncbi:uncharacterized protein LOC118440919 [Vespa mandarinia]|uniref:uncharacterized protein LOC118440919 n=1 Tax=Vespa mandarinia TaxID=7446 RepID=UPI0016188E3E|nr:uncharacterized protein LOC118440919 [Vespa mandarinia]
MYIHAHIQIDTNCIAVTLYTCIRRYVGERYHARHILKSCPSRKHEIDPQGHEVELKDLTCIAETISRRCKREYRVYARSSGGSRLSACYSWFMGSHVVRLQWWSWRYCFPTGFRYYLFHGTRPTRGRYKNETTMATAIVSEIPQTS